MDDQLRSLINDYQVAVAQAIAVLEDNGICERPLSRTNWVTNGMINKGTLGADGFYQKRGYGCLVDYQGLTIDFEFGEQGEADGFDIPKLNNFLEFNGRKHPLGKNNALSAAFKQAIQEKSIVGADTSLYYLKPST